MQKYHDEPKQYKGYLKSALGLKLSSPTLDDGSTRRVAKLSVEEPDAAEPARPDLWGARVSNDPGLPDPGGVQRLARLDVRCGDPRMSGFSP